MEDDYLEAPFIKSLLSEEISYNRNTDSTACSSAENKLPANAEPSFNADSASFESLKDYMLCVEKEYIKNCIDSCGGSISKAAEKLGIHRTAIYKKMKPERE